MRSIIISASVFLLGIIPVSAWSSDDNDSDGDGVANEADICPTTPYDDEYYKNVVDPEIGCSVWEICQCGGPLGTNEHWRNIGEYIECVSDTSRDFVDMGLLTHSERAQVISHAASMGCLVDGP